MTDSEGGAFFVGAILATLFWLALIGGDNEILPRHYEAAYKVCAVNDGVTIIYGHALFRRYEFSVECNNGAEFVFPSAEQT